MHPMPSFRLDDPFYDFRFRWTGRIHFILFPWWIDFSNIPWGENWFSSFFVSLTFTSYRKYAENVMVLQLGKVLICFLIMLEFFFYLRVIIGPSYCIIKKLPQQHLYELWSVSPVYTFFYRYTSWKTTSTAKSSIYFRKTTVNIKINTGNEFGAIWLL